MTTPDNERAASARALLAKHLPAGSTVYTVLKHVSRSRMSRTIAALIQVESGILDVSWAVAALGIGRFDRERGGVKVSGCGMDMGVHLVYELSHALFPDGHPCTGFYGHNGCPSNDHSNGGAYGLGVHHSEGGYALKQVWL